MTLHQLELELGPMPTWPSRRGEPIVAFVLPGPPQAWVRQQHLFGGNMGWPKHSPFARWRQWAIKTISEFWFGRGEQRPIRTPLVVYVEAVFTRPARAPKPTIDGEVVDYPWPWTDGRNPALVQEDVDNLAKAVLDVAQHEGALGCALLGNDRWIVDLRVVKTYAAVDEEPRTEVRIWRAA